MHRLVIARYAESLDWITNVPDDFDIVICNKGAPVTASAVLKRARVEMRPNVGREGETYLSQISAVRGAGGSGFTVFAQGDPFEHSPDFIALLQHVDLWQDVQPLSWRWKIKRDIPPSAILQRETGGFISGLRVRPETFSLTSWAPIGFDDPGTQWLNSNYHRLHGLPKGSNIAAHFLLLSGLPHLASTAGANRLGCFAYGALFAVRTEMLEDLPPDSLALMTEACGSHSVYGYVLERMWLHLFGMPFVLPLDLPEPELDHLPQPAPVFLPPESANTLRRRKLFNLVGRVRRLVTRE
jgi:hypothetical protein